MCAIGSTWLARRCDFDWLYNEALFAGLLHDVGKLFILTVTEEIKRSRTMKIQFSAALLNEVMNSLHTEYGYLLMKHWNFPEKYCEITREHHAEEFDANNFLLIIVRLADKACNKMGIGLYEDPSLSLATTFEANLLGLSEVVLGELEIKLEDSLHMAC